MTARALAGSCLLALVMLPGVAAAQVASSQKESDNTGNDLFRPPANLFQMMDEYKTAPGSGSAPGSTRDVTTETLNLRMDHSLDLAPLWILALRADLPLVAKNPITSDNPDGGYVGGVGDADVQAVIIHNLDARWAVGFGARLITPTGGDTLGSGKWQIMPAARMSCRSRRPVRPCSRRRRCLVRSLTGRSEVSGMTGLYGAIIRTWFQLAGGTHRGRSAE